MRIEFNIKFRPQIESGEYKVETGDGYPARIICWDSPIDKDRPVIAIVFDDQIEQYKADGRYDDDYESNYDLFIVTPEPEMSEFEKAVDAIYESCGVKELQVKKKASELLALAREELFANDTVLKEYAEEARKQGKAEALKDLPRWKRSKPELGRNYVLMFKGGSVISTTDFREDGRFYYEDSESYCDIHYNDSCVMWMYLDELLQLPGFKEDESHE